MENAVFEKLQERITHMLERFAALQSEKARLEELASKHEHDARDLKKRLDRALHERTSLKQRLTKVMEHIDSLNISD